LQQTFDALINTYIDDQVGIADNFLGSELAGHLADNLLSLYADDGLRTAGTGNSAEVLHDKSVRSDKICWLERQNNDPHEADFFVLMDRFVSHLNSSCYTGITGYEFHYALYETGSFYKKHLDQFRNNNSRKYSMIMYLNEGWKESDGGELCIYTGGTFQKIAPENGKSIFFKSDELAHEVLMTHKPRMSITGWLKVD
jgi:SM-20-related protein